MLGRLKFEIDDLVDEILNQLPIELFSTDGIRFVDQEMGGGQFIEGIVKRLRSNGFSDGNIQNRVFGFSQKEYWLAYVEGNPNVIGTLDIYDKEKISKMKKFDVVLGNPPYQKRVGPNKTQAIWPDFVKTAFELCKEGGYVSLIHPSGWRNPIGTYGNIRDLITEHDLKYLSVNSYDAGRKMFGASISFDWYIIKNTKVEETDTTIDFEDTKVDNVNVRDLEFIPTARFDMIKNLLAKDGDETVDIVYDRSSYGTDKSNMSKEKTEKYKYPCVYTITQRTGINKWYSNTKDNGHFGIPKVIWSNGMGTYPIVDMDGDCGLTQFSYGVVDKKENLEKIKKAMESDEFIQLMKDSITNDLKYDRKVISLFRKDFWKEFI